MNDCLVVMFVFMNKVFGLFVGVMFNVIDVVISVVDV